MQQVFWVLVGAISTIILGIVVNYLSGGVRSDAPLFRPVYAYRAWRSYRSKREALELLRAIERSMAQRDEYLSDPVGFFARLGQLHFATMMMLALAICGLSVWLWLMINPAADIATGSTATALVRETIGFLALTFVIGGAAGVLYVAVEGNQMAFPCNLRYKPGTRKTLASLHERWSPPNEPAPEVTAKIDALYTRWPDLRPPKQVGEVTPTTMPPTAASPARMPSNAP